MVRNWLIRLLQWLLGEQLPAAAPAQPSLKVALGQYDQALEEASGDSQMLHDALLARDRVEAALQEAKPPPTGQVRRLVELDARLRGQTANLSLKDLSTWRQTIRPPDTHWWWSLDQAAEKGEAEKDLPWVLLTGTLLAFTIPLALEIIKRLWDGAPDTVSVFGTLLTVSFTSSPLTKRGREFARWLLKRIPRLKRHFYAEAMAAMAVVAFVFVLTGRLLLPQLAEYYNDRGYDASRAGNLTTARRNFQRAVALDADMAEGYYHLGTVYEEIARPDEAIKWYQRALEYDLDLGAAYNNLGRLHILQGSPELAVPLLQAGLRHTGSETELELVTRYRLLSNLGWAYHALEQPTRARDVLEQAVALESDLDAAFKSAVPHYYLALTYEALKQPEAAVQQWEDSLRYLDSEDPDQGGWDETIRIQLDELREEQP
jgi:tetratricopeptide (TPR) repeat protein